MTERESAEVVREALIRDAASGAGHMHRWTTEDGAFTSPALDALDSLTSRLSELREENDKLHQDIADKRFEKADLEAKVSRLEEALERARHDMRWAANLLERDHEATHLLASDHTAAWRVLTTALSQKETTEADRIEITRRPS